MLAILVSFDGIGLLALMIRGEFTRKTTDINYPSVCIL